MEFPATVSKISNFLHKNQHILKTERMTNQQKLGIFNVQRQFLRPKMKLIPKRIFLSEYQIWRTKFITNISNFPTLKKIFSRNVPNFWSLTILSV